MSRFDNLLVFFAEFLLLGSNEAIWLSLRSSLNQNAFMIKKGTMEKQKEKESKEREKETKEEERTNQTTEK